MPLQLPCHKTAERGTNFKIYMAGALVGAALRNSNECLAHPTCLGSEGWLVAM